MKLLSMLTINRGNIIYDDKEMSLVSNLRDYAVAFGGAFFLLFSAGFNVFMNFNSETQKMLFITIPVLTISLGYFIVTLVQLINSLQHKEKWYEYGSIRMVIINEKGKFVKVTINFVDNTNQVLNIPNDRYFWQFVEILKVNRIEVVHTKNMK